MAHPSPAEVKWTQLRDQDELTEGGATEVHSALTDEFETESIIKAMNNVKNSLIGQCTFTNCASYNFVSLQRYPIEKILYGNPNMFNSFILILISSNVPYETSMS